MGIGEDIAKALHLDPIFDFIDKLKNFGNKLSSGVNKVVDKQEDAWGGFNNGFDDFFIDIIYLIHFTAEFFSTNLKCGFYYLQNAFSIDCSVWYFLTLVLNIIYGLTLGIIFLITDNGFGLDLKNSMWDFLHSIEDTTGFTFTDWPYAIRKKCFNCRRLKVSTLIEEWKIVFGDTQHTDERTDMKKIGNEMVAGFIEMGEGFNEIGQAFR